jgi:uncharacterized protein YndB with AHSA1/START domain
VDQRERRHRTTSMSTCVEAVPTAQVWWTRPMVDKLDISRDIAAPPEVVYAAISDVTRMGEWSEECYACEWHEGFDGAAVGATFDGHNRHGEHEWTSQGKVTQAEPGRAFAFECSMFDFHYSTWGYRIEPTATGCRVTEWSEDLRPDSALELSKQMSGVDDRPERNRQTMSGTLERLAAAVED